jgi:hypothetical protein
LGGPVAFQYCLGADDDEKPCPKTIDCWWEYFDVVGYVKAHLSERAFKRLSQHRPADKTASLVDLIEKAKQRLADP